MKRTFIAIPVKPSDDFIEFYYSIKRNVQGKINWAVIDYLHLTLGFFGTTSPDHERQIIITLQKIVKQNEPFSLLFEGLGVFPSNTKPRVIWVGLKQNRGLTKLYDDLWNELTNYGLIKDKKSFKPHLTLGRIKWVGDKTKLFHLLSENHKRVILRSRVSEIMYYESALTPSGPLYKELGKFSLSSKQS